MGLELATAAFWLFLTVVVASLIWRKALQRREVLITLRAAIDKGLPLDDQRLQALLAMNTRPQSVSHDFFLVFGVILAAGGVCVLVLALFAEDRAPLVFVGLCAAIMAVALIFLWRLFAQRSKRDGAALQ
jgi:membrane protein implicated in regulation of membrane protease activity